MSLTIYHYNAAQTLAEILKQDLDKADNDIIDIVASKSSELESLKSVLMSQTYGTSC